MYIGSLNVKNKKDNGDVWHSNKKYSMALPTMAPYLTCSTFNIFSLSAVSSISSIDDSSSIDGAIVWLPNALEKAIDACNWRNTLSLLQLRIVLCNMYFIFLPMQRFAHLIIKTMLKYGPDSNNPHLYSLFIFKSEINMSGLHPSSS